MKTSRDKLIEAGRSRTTNALEWIARGAGAAAFAGITVMSVSAMASGNAPEEQQGDYIRAAEGAGVEAGLALLVFTGAVGAHIVRAGREDAQRERDLGFVLPGSEPVEQQFNS